MPNSVASVGRNAFAGCETLVSARLPEKLSTISDALFADCKALAEVNIPYTVIVIDDDAFRACQSLQSISIPATVTRIGNYAFDDCSSLYELFSFGNEPPALGRDAIPESVWVSIPRNARKEYREKWTGHAKFNYIKL